METPDPIENFFSQLSFNDQQSEQATFLMSANMSVTTPTKSSNYSDPLSAAVKELLDSLNQPKRDYGNSTKDSTMDLLAEGLEFLEAASSDMEKVIQSKEELRQLLNQPQADNVLRIDCNKHKSFLDMITCMSQVGERYEDYSSLTSEKFVSSLKEHVETLEDVNNLVMQSQQLLTNTAADLEVIKKKKLFKNA